MANPVVPEGWRPASKKISDQYFNAINGEDEYPEGTLFDGQTVYVEDGKSASKTTENKTTENNSGDNK